jgi:hypothetical protein
MPTEQQDPPTLKQLRWLEGWFERLSTPGPKAELRIEGRVTPVPYPEASRLECEQTLAKIRELIAQHPDSQEE